IDLSSSLLNDGRHTGFIEYRIQFLGFHVNCFHSLVVLKCSAKLYLKGEDLKQERCFCLVVAVIYSAALLQLR
ncbi:MAG: hypothetical protein ACK56F_18930, partial [bacterium]